MEGFIPLNRLILLYSLIYARRKVKHYIAQACFPKMTYLLLNDNGTKSFSFEEIKF